jgi:hypothetical protein
VREEALRGGIGRIMSDTGNSESKHIAEYAEKIKTGKPLPQRSQRVTEGKDYERESMR